jgi:photosystem II stability/assembly factor-like uncharacterized protein
MLKLLQLLLVMVMANPLTAQWNDVTPTTGFIHQVSVINKDRVVAMTEDSNGVHLRATSDRGQNWTSIPVPVWTSTDPLYLRGVQFTDAQHGFVYGDWLVNGGVFAPNGNESFALFATSNGGQTWEPRLPTVPQQALQSLNSIHFFNPEQGVITLTSGLGYTLIQTTDDGGLTWTSRDTIFDYLQPESERLNTNGNGYAIRSRYENGATQQALYRIEDFGQTWENIGVPGAGANWPQQRTGLWYDRTYYLNDNQVIRLEPFSTGGAPVIYKYAFSNDGGAQWTTDFFTVQDVSVSGIQLFDNVLWFQTREGLYWRSLQPSSSVEVARGAATLQAAPNPVMAGTTLTLRAPAALSGGGTIRLYQMDGRLVQEQIADNSGDIATFRVPANLLPGVYQVQWAFDNGFVARQSVVVR